MNAYSGDYGIIWKNNEGLQAGPADIPVNSRGTLVIEGDRDQAANGALLEVADFATVAARPAGGGDAATIDLVHRLSKAAVADGLVITVE